MHQVPCQVLSMNYLTLFSQQQSERGRYYPPFLIKLRCTNIKSCIHNNRRRQWHPTPVLLPGKSHGQRSLVGCSPYSGKELDTTERLSTHAYFQNIYKLQVGLKRRECKFQSTVLCLSMINPFVHCSNLL